MIQIMKNTKSVDFYLITMLLAWWLLNLIQSAFTGLANDESYYWLFARELDWGYFDHPPMAALLVKLGDFIGGELGVRLFFTILQPLYLYVLWLLIRPESPTPKDALLFVLICFAMPILQLYGFIAVPDAPLMMFSALFLWAYNRFCKSDNWGNMLLLSISMALLAYSKYHGALVVIFTVLSNLRILLKPKFYLSGLITLVLYIPHFMWQYNHDWASFYYHLLGRNGYFRWRDISEFWLNLLLIFNPFYVPLYIKGFNKGHYADAPVQRALYFITIGFVTFFSLSSLRGYVQPQWVIPITFGLIMILFGWSRDKERVRRYVMKVGYCLAGLMIVVRLVVLFNPFNIKFELFNNESSYAAIAEVAGDRPIIFGYNYWDGAKYKYYTGNEAYCQPSINYRTSHWMFRDDDRHMAGKDVIVELYNGTHNADGRIELDNGRSFTWRTIPDFYPVREVEIDVLNEIPEVVSHGDTIRFQTEIKNPYDYDVKISKDGKALKIAWGRNKEFFKEYFISSEPFTVPANSTVRKDFESVVPDNLDKPEYRMGLIITNHPVRSWFNSDEYKIKIEK